MRKSLFFLIISAIFFSCEQSITINTTRGRYIASNHLSKINGKEKVSRGIKQLLHEEQNLHNKDLWDANAFSSNINPDYVPEQNPKFPLAYYLIPEDEIRFLKADSLDERIGSQLVMKISGKKHYKLFVHPESEAHYDFLKNAYRYIGPEETEFSASPTSSYRSLVVWNHNNELKKPFIAKVSLDKNVIGSIDRLVSENEVERSVANQKAFDRMGKEKLSAMNVKIFPESAGFVINKAHADAPQKLGGQLIREIPDEVEKGEKKWLSFSALMSPKQRPHPLIMDVIKASGMSSFDFFDKIMIHGYLAMFEQLSLINGINFEPHSQNLCFETTTDLKPTGKWIIRDFGGVWPDVIAMAKNKGPLNVYMESASARKYKLRGGRANYISSYVFFYKRQVFDLMLAEVAKHDSALTPELIRTLKSSVDNAYLKKINQHLELALKDVPTMSNYKKIEEIVINHTKLDDKIFRKQLTDSMELQTFISVKKSNEEWIELAQVSAPGQFFLTDHGVYEIAGGKVVGMGLFNQLEKEDYQANKGHLSWLMPISPVSKNTNCGSIMTSFF